MAFPMDLKVVKVGDIDSPREEQVNLLYDSAIESDDDLQEKGGAPDNWPHIPELSKPRCCETCGERTNCVNKAVEHLQILLSILSDWIQKTDKKKAPKDTVNQKLSISDCDPKDRKRALVPLNTNIVSTRCVKALKDYNSHDQLKAVVNEVMLLLAWLHKDCQKTEAKLFSEIAFNKKMSCEINRIWQQKQTDMKEKVQIEHALPRKLRMMQHVILLKNIHAIKKQKLHSERFFNFCIKKDISIRFKRIPLTKIKMIEENKEINKVQNCLNEAEGLMQETLEVLPKTAFQYNEALQIVRNEENLIQQQINEVVYELNMLHDAATIAEQKFYFMSRGIVEGKEGLENIKIQLMELRVKLENSKAASFHKSKEATEEKKKLIRKMKTKIIRINQEENRQAEMQKMKMDYDIILKKLQKQMTEQELIYRTLVDGNNKADDRVDKLNMKKEASKTRKEFYENNLKRLNNEIIKMENDVQFMLFELSRFRQENKMMFESTEESQAEKQDYETTLSNKIVVLGLKISVEDENYLELIESVKHLEYEMKAAKADVEDEKKKTTKKLDAKQVHVDKTQEKTDRLLVLKSQRDQVLGRLNTEKERITEKHLQTIQENELYLKNLKPYRQMSITRCIQLELKIKELLQDTDKLTMDNEVLMERHRILVQTLDKNQDAINKFTVDLEKIDLKTKITEKQNEYSENRQNEVNERLKTENEEHTDLMICRKETLEEILQKKKDALKLNEELATKYRGTQNTLMQKKKEFVQLSEDAARLQWALRDLKQVMKLQLKMNRGNRCHLEIRGAWHKKTLAHYVKMSEGSLKKFKQLQLEYIAIEKIITANLDAIRLAMLKNEHRFFPKINQDVLPKITQPNP